MHYTRLMGCTRKLFSCIAHKKNYTEKSPYFYFH